MMTATDNDLFYQAAGILRKAHEKRGTIKTLVYSSGFENIRQLFALVSECTKKRVVLEKIATDCPEAFHQEAAIQQDFEVAIVLLHEYLLGRKFGRAVNLRKLFQKYKTVIKSVVNKVLEQYGASTLKDACQMSEKKLLPKIPRYMRVNLIKASVESAIKDLESEEWEFVGKFTQGNFRERALVLNQWQFGLDPILPDLLVFPPGTDLHDHRLTTSGVLVQQDRASCIPAHVVCPAPASTVLDTCAAPGNKTSHLASLLEDNGRVIALDRDMKRLGTMTRLLGKSGATCVELIHQDFLTVEPSSTDAGAVQFILVDPSCSGSGMLNNQTNNGYSDVSMDRIQTLKRFQISILKHALKFPNVQRVVYSTCSVHQQENEEVAEEVMSQVSDEYQFGKVFPAWQGSRGLKEFSHSEFFLRLSPEQDLTQGFFVACFERLKCNEAQTEDTEVTWSEINKRDQLGCHEKIGKSKTKKLPDSEITEKEQTAVTNDADTVRPVTDTDTSTTQKHKKKRKHDCMKTETVEVDSESVSDLVSCRGQKSKKKKNRKAVDNDSEPADSEEKQKKRKKKLQAEPIIDSSNEVTHQEKSSHGVKRKKKKRA